jgi:hypothetical protein
VLVVDRATLEMSVFSLDSAASACTSGVPRSA